MLHGRELNCHLLNLKAKITIKKNGKSLILPLPNLPKRKQVKYFQTLLCYVSMQYNHRSNQVTRWIRRSLHFIPEFKHLQFLVSCWKTYQVFFRYSWSFELSDEYSTKLFFQYSWSFKASLFCSSMSDRIANLLFSKFTPCRHFGTLTSCHVHTSRY